MIVDLQASIEKAISEYINDGKADLLILNRLAALNNRPRCEVCSSWDKQTMYCLDALSKHCTTQPTQLCDRFKRNEAPHD